MNLGDHDIPFGIDEEAERLIGRHLDGEITVSEQARLDQILAASAEARIVLEDYRRIDSMATAAMKRDLAGHTGRSGAAQGNGVISLQSRLQPWLMGAAGAVLAAAAVVLVSIAFNADPRGPALSQQTSPTDRPRIAPQAPGELVDYRDVDYQPRQTLDSVYRDLIGIRGSNPNRIYIFEREAKATRTVPVSGDF